jgi:hypothetical protein
MKVKSMVAIGFVSAMAAIGIPNASDGVASEGNRPDIIEERVGQGGSIYYRQHMASRAGICDVAGEEQNRGEFVEERIGHGGSIYYKRSMAGRIDACDANRSGAGWVYSPPVAH